MALLPLTPASRGPPWSLDPLIPCSLTDFEWILGRFLNNFRSPKHKKSTTTLKFFNVTSKFDFCDTSQSKSMFLWFCKARKIIKNRSRRALELNFFRSLCWTPFFFDFWQNFDWFFVDFGPILATKCSNFSWFGRCRTVLGPLFSISFWMLPQSLIFATPPNQKQGFCGFAKVEKSWKIDSQGYWNLTFLQVYVEPLCFSIFNQILIDFWSILDQFWPPSARLPPGFSTPKT